MALLHTVNKSPFDRNSFESCLGHAVSGSSILFFEDAVVGAVSGTRVSDAVSAAISSGVSVAVLGPDFAARGMDESKLIDGIKVVDYAGFVALTTESDAVQAWL